MAVSQQPDPVKLPGQVRQADNVYLDPTFGCVKRPATKYIANLGTEIPSDAKWFPIFRDDDERYMGCVYNDNDATPKTQFRVFEADSGIERNVTYEPDVGDYLNPGPFEDLQFLTINDFTFITNPAVTVTMDSGKSQEPAPTALVVVNQVGYNTTYSIDLLKEDETLDQVKKYTATELQVRPGSFEEEDDEGNCSLAGTQEFVEDSGLKYRLTVNCQPVQVTKYKAGTPYPTQVVLASTTSEQEFADWATVEFGSPFDYALNSYAYANKTLQIDDKDITVRIEGRCVRICTYGEDGDGNDKNRIKWVVSSLDVISYENGGTGKNKWKEGGKGTIEMTSTSELKSGYSDSGFDVCDERSHEVQEGEKVRIRIEVAGLDKGPKTPTYSYKSSYTANVQLLNGGIDVRKGDTITCTLNNKEYKIVVKNEGVTYAYEADASVSYTTSSDITAGPLNVSTITGALISELNDLNGFEAEGIGNVIKITRANNKKFNISARGGSTENAMYGIKDRVNDISKLPTTGFPGVILKVQNSIDSDSDDYYVQFNSSEGIPGAGNWEETVKPGIKTSLNASTMPHVLKRRASGNFKLARLDGDDDNVLSYADREVGDDNTNPIPTFVGQTISNMVFHMNRFGFLSEDTVVLSQPGDYFNFFVGSAIAVSDADPIDMAATSTRPASLTNGVSTAQGLLLFSSDAQFLMNSKDVAFGPSTVQINEISNYSYRSTVSPMTVGTSIFFNSDSTNFSKVFEMATESIGQSPQVAEDTRIVPEYVPNKLEWGAASSNNNLALYGSKTNEVYCFKYWNQGKERSLAGWFRWQFLHRIQLISFADDVAYIIFYNDTTGDNVLGTMSLMDDPDVATIWADDRSFEPRLDLYAPFNQLVVDEGVEETRIELPDGTYAGQELAYVQYTKSQGTYFTASPVLFDDDASQTSPHIILKNETLEDARGYNLGIAYNMSIELPGFYVKDEKRVDRVNLPMIETVNIELYLSGSYTVQLEKLGYPDRLLYFDAKVSDVYRADRNPIIETSRQELSVFSRGDHASVTITSLDPLPAGITGYTWEGHYSNRGISRL